jgi:molybdopterin converting factor small subunit
MIIGGHSIIYSRDADADRRFFRDVLRFPNADAGDGWLIFGLPPAEVAFHPGEQNDEHEFYLMCADVAEFVAEMARHGIACDPVADHGYGLVTQITLPGGGKLGVYEPRHARPSAGAAPRGRRRRPASPSRARSQSPRSARQREGRSGSRAGSEPAGGRGSGTASDALYAHPPLADRSMAQPPPVTVHVPWHLRDAAGGALERSHPAIHKHICDESGAVRRHLSVFVNASHVRDRDGLDTAVAPGDVVSILTAVSGG